MSVHLFGVTLLPGDVRAVITALIADGSAHAVFVAGRLLSRLERNSGGMVPLTPAQRDAVLAALHDPPHALGTLRQVLVRDKDRRGAVVAAPSALLSVAALIPPT